MNHGGHDVRPSLLDWGEAIVNRSTWLSIPFVKDVIVERGNSIMEERGYDETTGSDFPWGNI